MKYNLFISLILAMAFLLGALTMYLVLWYDVWQTLIETIERVSL